MADTASHPAPRTQRRYTTADIMALIEAGVVAENARFELWAGEIEKMSPKGPLHEDVRIALSDWIRALPMRLTWLIEPTLHFSDDSYLEPDYIIFDRGLRPADLKPSQTRLIIEVADSSWQHDSTIKAARYAAHGVQEYWAIHAPTRMTRVHRASSAQGWGAIRDYACGESIIALCAPDTPLRLTPA
jgi:Uma2 family endonuclease